MNIRKTHMTVEKTEIHKGTNTQKTQQPASLKHKKQLTDSS